MESDGQPAKQPEEKKIGQNKLDVGADGSEAAATARQRSGPFAGKPAGFRRRGARINSDAIFLKD